MDVIAIRNKGIELGLDLTLVYRKLSFEELKECVNGIGPAWFPEWLLEEVTDYFEYFLPSVGQHDCDFKYQPKTEEEFNAANERFLRNMKIQIKNDRHLSWWHFCKKTSKWRKYSQAKFLYEMCDNRGRGAFFNK